MKSLLVFLLLAVIDPSVSWAPLQPGRYLSKHPATTTTAIWGMPSEMVVSTPTSDEAASMGIREWPQQLKTGSWQETCGEGQHLVRYVLDGMGELEITATSGETTKTVELAPGTLVEVTGPAELQWKATSEMIVLTPGFEEGGKLLAVAALLIAVCGGLIALS